MNKAIGLGCLGVALVAVLLLGMGGCVGYNSLVTRGQSVDAQWAQVESQYQRRFDLIPNLVKTVQGQAGFEQSTLTAIADARASVGRVQLKAGTVPDEQQLQQWEGAQARLGGALGRLMAVSENYPDLKANQGFLGLQAELAGTENRIAVERGRFNEAVQDYNTAVKRFPTVLYAGMFGFSPKAYFKGTVGSDAPPQVEFNFGKGGAQGSAAPAPAPRQAEAPALPAPSSVPVPQPVK